MLWIPGMTKNGTTVENPPRAIDERIEGIKGSVRDFVDKSEKRASEIKTRVISVKDEAMTRGNAVVEKATDFIQANPLKAVGLAFGIGYIGMRLFRR